MKKEGGTRHLLRAGPRARAVGLQHTGESERGPRATVVFSETALGLSLQRTGYRLRPRNIRLKSSIRSYVFCRRVQG